MVSTTTHLEEMSMKTIIASLAFTSLTGLSQAQDQVGSATINFRIIVPEMMQITPSLHPSITSQVRTKDCSLSPTTSQPVPQRHRDQP